MPSFTVVQASLSRHAYASIAALLVLGAAALARTPQAHAQASFAEQVSFAAGDEPNAIAVADLNRDGTLDLAVASTRNPAATDEFDQRGAVSVLLGDGAGGFGPATHHVANNAPVAVAAGDLNRDGRLDLAVANHYSHDVSVLLGDGAGGFGETTNFATVGLPGPTSVAAGDVSGDGAPDLVVGNERAGGLVVLVGDGSGAFGPPTLVAPVHVRSVALGDLNDDGRLDVAAAHAGGTEGDGIAGVVVLLGGPGGLGPPAAIGAGPYPSSVAIGDLDRDGALDLAVTNSNVVDTPIAGAASVLLGDGAGGFGPPSSVTTGPGLPASAAVGDLDGDGRLDVALTNATSPGGLPGSALVLSGDGAGRLGAPLGFGVGLRPASLAIGDLDGDGALDLVVANADSDTVSVLRNTTGAGNLVRNPSFEASTAGWGSFSGTLSRVAAGDAPDGGWVARARRVAGSSYSISDNHNGVPTVPSVVAGEGYVASCHVRAATAQSVGRPARIVLRERVGASGAFIRETTATAPLAASFKRLSVAAEAVGDQHSMGLRCEQLSAVSGDAFDADLMTLARVSPVGGSTTAGSVWSAATVNTKRASTFTLTAPRDVVSLHAYVDGKAGGTGGQPVTGVLYAGTASAPTSLVATTSAATITAGRAAGWLKLRFPAPVRLAPGTYWIGLHSGGTIPVMRFAAQAVGGALRFKNDSYADGATATFGAASTDGKLLSLYAAGG